eukprot:2810534-Amphidinium_carterae.4
MFSKLGMSKKEQHIELKYLDLKGLVEAGVITMHKFGTQNNPSDMIHPHQVHATIHTQQAFQQVSIQCLRNTLSAISSSSTPELDVRTPKSREKMSDDSIAVSSQETP